MRIASILHKTFGYDRTIEFVKSMRENPFGEKTKQQQEIFDKYIELKYIELSMPKLEIPKVLKLYKFNGETIKNNSKYLQYRLYNHIYNEDKVGVYEVKSCE